MNINLSIKQLSYLKKLLVDIGFKESNNSFSKEYFNIAYSLNESPNFLLKEVEFSLLKKLPKKKYSFRKIELTIEGDRGKMKFRYD